MNMKKLTEKIQANDFFTQIYFKIIFVFASMREIISHSN